MTKLFSEFIEDSKRRNKPIHFYLLLIVLGVVLPFFVRSSYSPASLIGTSTVLWKPLFAALIALDLGMSAVRWICVGVLICYPVVLIASYLLAVFRENYLPLMIAAFFDILFTVFLIVLMICAGTFSNGHVVIALGMLVNFCFNIYFYSVWKYMKQELKRQENP